MADMKHPLLKFILCVLLLAYSNLGFSSALFLFSSEATVQQELSTKENSRWHYLQLVDGGISERQAASIAKSAYGGSVMKVSRKGSVYHVKLLKDGRVRIVKVDANSGAILGG